MFTKAERIKKLPPYLFAEIDKKVQEALDQGIEIIKLGIGDPDQPTPDHIVTKAIKEIRDPKNHQYPSYAGMKEYKEAVANYYAKRFNVSISAKEEVVSLIGSKEGIAHISLCYVNPNDLVLVPDPGYPVYSIGSMFAGGECYKMPLLAENNYLPDLDAISEYIAKAAKIMFLNYPNNPTGAVATKEFFEKVVAFARKNNVIVCHDAAYGEIGFNGYKPISFMETPGAKEVGIEFGSLSKTYNMTGWRVAYAVGNQEIIESLGLIKTNVDSGIFQPIQYGAIEALNSDQSCVGDTNNLYKKRGDFVVETLNRLGWNLEKPKATFYIWAPVPRGYTSQSFATFLLEKAGVVVTPGIGFGEYGEGYFRISLTVDDEKLMEAMRRIEQQLAIVE